MTVEIDLWPGRVEYIRPMLRLHGHQVRRTFTRMTVLTVLSAAGLLGAAWALGQDYLLGLGIGLLPFSLLLIWFRCYQLPYGVPRQIARWSAQGTVRVVIDRGGIRETRTTGEVFYPWDAVERYQEDQGGFILYFADGFFRYLPKRPLTELALLELEDHLRHLEG
jgi:hypothetical protein